MWMQNTLLHYVVNLFFWRFAVIFFSDFISNCLYTAILEDHCIFILVGITAQSKLPVFRHGHWILGRKWVLQSSPKQVSPWQQEQITLVYLCTGSLDCVRSPISIEGTETLKIVTAVGLCEHIWIKKQSVLEEKYICKWNDTFTHGSRVINP